MASESSEKEKVSAISYRSHSPTCTLITCVRQLNLFAVNVAGGDRGGAPGSGLRRPGTRSFPPAQEAGLDVVAGFRAREEERGLVGVRELLYVPRGDFRLV